MYKIRGKVKETEKTLFFNCIFCHTERTFPVQSLSCCREGEGVGRRNVTDVCRRNVTDVCKALLRSMARLSQLFAWVSSRNRCFGSSWLQGPLVGPGCTAAELSEAPPSCASICRSHCFLQGPRIVSLQGGPTGVAGWPGASWSAAGENKGAVSGAKCFTPFSNVLCRCLQCHFNI